MAPSSSNSKHLYVSISFFTHIFFFTFYNNTSRTPTSSSRCICKTWRRRWWMWMLQLAELLNRRKSWDQERKNSPTHKHKKYRKPQVRATSPQVRAYFSSPAEEHFCMCRSFHSFSTDGPCSLWEVEYLRVRLTWPNKNFTIKILHSSLSTYQLWPKYLCLLHSLRFKNCTSDKSRLQLHK